MVRARFLLLVLLLLAGIAVMAAPRIDQKVVLINKRPMISLIDFAELFNAEVDYNVERDEISITLDNTTVYLVPYRMTAWVNARKVWLDMPVVIVDDVTYLPVRFLCDAFDLRSNWVQDDREVVIINCRTTERIVLVIDIDWGCHPHVWRHDFDRHTYIHFHPRHHDNDRKDCDGGKPRDGLFPPNDGVDHNGGVVHHTDGGKPDAPKHVGIDTANGPAGTGGVIVKPDEPRHDGAISKPENPRPTDVIIEPENPRPADVITKPEDPRSAGGIEKPDAPRNDGIGKPEGDQPKIVIERPDVPRNGGIGRPEGDRPIIIDRPGNPQNGGIGKPDGPRQYGIEKPDGGRPQVITERPGDPQRGGIGKPERDNPRSGPPAQASGQPENRDKPQEVKAEERSHTEKETKAESRDSENNDKKEKGKDESKSDRKDK